MDNEQIYSVSQVNLYIKNMFMREHVLNNIYIKGEVSNCKYHSSGHIYFTLKDGKGQMACVMFAGQRSGLSFRMCEGQSIIVLGSISVYERDGKYQLYARQILLDGFGALYEQFEQLKRKLQQEGLFEETHKKPIPFYNKRIGIVTADTGAAIHDIQTISARRNPYAQLILYPARVQGEQAAKTIIAGINRLEQERADVIIVGRGGGSIEDLWAFNEESVARAIYQCSVPIISAVGHETDTTIADFVADLRAPTPSAAAELAVCEIAELEAILETDKEQLLYIMQRKVRRYREQLEQYKKRMELLSPSYQLRQKQQYLIDCEERMRELMKYQMQKKRHRLELYIERMKALSPLDKLKSGYGFVTDESEQIVHSIEDTAVGEHIKISLYDGDISAVVEQKMKRRRE